VLEAIHAADTVMLAPGSLYTSLLPNLLVGGVADAIRQSSAVKILISNLMTQPGETDGFSASDHLRAVETCLGRGVIDYCVINSTSVRVGGLRHLESGSQLVVSDIEQVGSMGPIPVEDDLVALDGERIRHNPNRLARLVVSIVRARSRQMLHVGRKSPIGSQNDVSIYSRQIHEVAGRSCGVHAVRINPCAGPEHY
jgi:uncharacterized cofD-like protein